MYKVIALRFMWVRVMHGFLVVLIHPRHRDRRLVVNDDFYLSVVEV